jgi:hypothetical protein
MLFRQSKQLALRVCSEQNAGERVHVRDLGPSAGDIGNET